MILKIVTHIYSHLLSLYLLLDIGTHWEEKVQIC